MRFQALAASHFISNLVFIGLIKFVACDINAGEQMTSASRCKSNCVDQGGVFCRGFGDETFGYCCYQQNQLPCDQRSMICTNPANDVSKYYSCPFDTSMCGTQTLDVTDTIQEFEVYSMNFKNYTFCGYQFRKVNVNSKTINIKVIYAGDRLQFQAVQGEVINKGYNLKNLQSNQLYSSKANERIFLIAQSVSPMPDSFKVQYYLFTPPDDDVDQGSSQTTNSQTNSNTNQNQTTSSSSSTGSSDTQSSQSNKTIATKIDNNYQVTQQKSGGSGTAIVVVIAVLIILIPVGFGISCIWKRIRDRKNQDNEQEAMQLPDHSQINHTNMSPEHASHFTHQQNNNLYPFNSPIDDSQNMQSVMNAIQALERGDDEPIQFIEILGKHGAPVTIPIDQLPQFLQDMALNDPEIFHQLMADMDEERLEEFIREQETHNNQNNFYPSNIPVHSDMGMNLPQMDFVDPMYLNEQQNAFNQFQKVSNSKKGGRRDNNFMMNNGPVEDINQPQQHQQQQHIDLDDNENNNLDMLVNGGGGGQHNMDIHGNEVMMDGDDPQIIYEQPRKKKTKKKKKKKAAAANGGGLVMEGGPIEIIEDFHTPDVPVVIDPQE